MPSYVAKSSWLRQLGKLQIDNTKFNRNHLGQKEKASKVIGKQDYKSMPGMDMSGVHSTLNGITTNNKNQNMKVSAFYIFYLFIYWR